MIDNIIQNTNAAAEKTKVLREYVGLVGNKEAIKEVLMADKLFRNDGVYRVLTALGGIASVSQDVDALQKAVDAVLDYDEEIGSEKFAETYKQLNLSLSDAELVAPLAMMGIGFNLALAARYERAAVAELGEEKVSGALAAEALKHILAQFGK